MILLLLLSVCPAILASIPGLSGSVPAVHHVQLGVNPPGINGQPPPINPVEIYLSDFGYTTTKTTTSPQSPFNLQMALLRFQLYHGLYRSGVFDDPTEQLMALYRCGAPDMQNGAALKAAMLLAPRFRHWKLRLNRKFLHKFHLEVRSKDVWKKKVLTWTVIGKPSSLSRQDTDAAVKDAFDKWQAVADFHFIHTTSGQADIVIAFEAMLDRKLPTVVSTVSPTERAKIIVDKEQEWNYKQLEAPGSLNLFRTMVHLIGHALGLQHVPEVDSVMNPLFKTSQTHSRLPEIPQQDTVELRKLYGLPLPVSATSPDASKLKCPKHLDSVTNVDDHTWFLFKDYHVYKVNDGKIAETPARISEMFPDGPDFVNASVTSRGLTILFAERTVYGYEFDGRKFTQHEDFPRDLHERVLFFPQAAFPLNNGSVVILSGNVFATYNVVQNVPQILNDKNRVFPNLPFDLRSGIPIKGTNFKKYWMFDETTVAEWDATTHQAGAPQPITEYFKCAP